MKIKFFIAVLVSCLFMTGCTNMKNIQDLTYIVAIGMDYNQETKQYTAYIQGLNFANVAKQEGSRPVEPIPIYIASATGETLNLAVSKLYSKSEPPLFFGHVTTLVLSKNIVTHQFNEVIKEVGRNRSLRSTLRVLTTEEDIEEVFNIKALFNYPAVYTVLFKKGDTELFQDELKPSNLMTFLREYNEPMGTTKLPSVKIDPETWQADKSYPVLYFDGFAIFQQQKYIKSLSFKDSVYLNWLSEKNVSLTQRVEEAGELAAVVKIAAPKMKIKYADGTETPKMTIELSARADLLEKVKDLPLDRLTKLIEEDMKEKLKAIYADGVANNADVLNVGKRWFRENPQKYRSLAANREFYLEESSLQDIKVNVQIFHFNSYKYQPTGSGAFR
jgi:spore germination protein KC